MAQHSMPYLIFNYGGEMIFILEHRLSAQSVKNEKAKKVLQDVSAQLFQPPSVTELMRPQFIYSHAMTRDVFDKLAKCSIMSLSGQSMDKLYNLMTMGCKYQLISCYFPRQVPELTLRILRTLASSLEGKNAENIQCAIEMLEHHSRKLTIGELQDVKHSLLNFYLGKRTPVSLFLQEKLQTASGSFVLNRGGPAPTCSPHGEGVGEIRYFHKGNLLNHTRIPHPDDKIPCDSHSPSPLGRQLYGIERHKPGPIAVTQSSQHVNPPPVELQGTPEHYDGVRAVPSGRHHQVGSTLSAFFVEHTVPQEAFRINLFPTDVFAETQSATMQTTATMQMSRGEVERTNSEIVNVIRGFDVPCDPPPSAEGDLLDLMDGM